MHGSISNSLPCKSNFKKINYQVIFENKSTYRKNIDRLHKIGLQYLQKNLKSFKLSIQ